MTPPLGTLALFLGSADLIYLACEYFVNGVEWAGYRFDFGQNAPGTILAAFGTALPESVVTFVAVVFGRNPAQKEIGIGAALGGPLVLWNNRVCRRGLRSACKPLRTGLRSSTSIIRTRAGTRAGFS